jgi:hypothetical protein
MQSHQVIVAADVTGSGSEQSMLLPMIEQTGGCVRRTRSSPPMPAITATRTCRRCTIEVSLPWWPTTACASATNAVQSIKLYRPGDFSFNDDRTATCPAGKTLTGTGRTYAQAGHRFERYEARASDCASCHLRTNCLRSPKPTRGRQVARFQPMQRPADDPSQRMREAIDSVPGRSLYSQRIATVEPVFANIRHHKRMSRFTLRGQAKVSTQWQLYCLVHNIEKVATQAMRAE